ncbi:MAG: cytochrome c biogenesis protein CcsA [Gammaproteobacteria bacterium]|nr:cytochrome c biogenesis protein CcsA [Gammaproteobacteria bacterium]
MNNYIFTFSAIILYFTCAALLFFHIKKTDQNTGGLSKKTIVLIGLAGLILHSLALYNGMVSPAGIDLGFYSAMSLVSVFITLFTLIAVWRYPVEILAITLLPIASITMMFDFNNETHHLLDANSSNALIFHILTSIIAYSLLALAALQAILLSIQNKLLHAHQPGGIIKFMPPLRNMEVLLFEVIVVGFISLTISLGSGLIFLENMFAQQLAHKTVLSILAWFVFLILLIGHWKLGWRGRVAIRWTLSGFASLMLAYFGSKFVLEILLA